nr:leucine-rich repeat extensin-like protein 2 [Ipomoea batatas]
MKMRQRRSPRLFFVFVYVTLFLGLQICASDDADDDIVNAAKRLNFENQRLRDAYIALQSWKAVILSDPLNFTLNWVGPDVCSYTGVYCAPLPTSKSKASVKVVAGIDLNHADIAGHLVPQLGLLSHLALFHLNSNRFCGVVPRSFKNMTLLRELDLSNNRFAGGFPRAVLSMPSLKFLDLRFNEFEGPVPSKLFDKDLDALFLNDNRFRFGIPENLGNSPVSVLVFANNDLGGCIPASIAKMGKTLNQLILLNDNLTGCLPPQIGMLKKLTVFDVGFNKIQGPLPSSVGSMKSLEQLNVAHNRLTGVIPGSVCQLPRLQNFTYSFNYFSGEAPACVGRDGRENCIPGKKGQRSARECSSDDAKPFDCRKSSKCGGSNNFASSPKSKTKSKRRARPSPPSKSSPAYPPPPSKSSSSSHTRSHPSPPLLSSPPPPTQKVHFPPPPPSQNTHQPPPPPPNDYVKFPPPEHSSITPPPSSYHSSYTDSQSVPPPPPPPLHQHIPLPPVKGVPYASPPPPVIPYY